MTTVPASTQSSLGEAAKLLRRAAAAATATPGVSGLSSLGGTATNLPGERLDGIRFRDDESAVDIRMTWGANAQQVGAAVQAAVYAVRPQPVRVRVVEIDDPGTTAPARRTRRAMRTSTVKDKT